MAEHGTAEPGWAQCQPQTTLPTASQFAMARDSGQVVASIPMPGPVVLLAGSQAAATFLPGDEPCQRQAAGGDGACLSLPGFPVTLMCSLARWSCCRPHGPSPCRNRMHGSPLLCPRRPPPSFAGTRLAGASGLLIRLPAGGRRVPHSSHPPPSHLEHPSPLGHLPAGPLGPLRVPSLLGATRRRMCYV